MKTLLLDTLAWDLLKDVQGNIALASEPYSLAQDAASAIRLFQGECYYNTSTGVPYWASILGASPPPIALMKAQFIAAAKTVPGVVAAQCFITSVSNRRVSGQVQISDKAGVITAAAF